MLPRLPAPAAYPLSDLGTCGVGPFHLRGHGHQPQPRSVRDGVTAFGKPFDGKDRSAPEFLQDQVTQPRPHLRLVVQRGTTIVHDLLQGGLVADLVAVGRVKTLRLKNFSGSR